MLTSLSFSAKMLVNRPITCGDGCCTENYWDREDFPAGEEFDEAEEDLMFQLEDMEEGIDFERITY